MANLKTVLKTTACVALSALTLFGATACAQEKEIVNAYDIAVKNGFVGTEEEWLLSLHGANGKDGESLNIYDLYEAAKASENGYEGDILQFIKEYIDGEIQVLPDNNDTKTIAKNATSVVSVYCAFRQQSNWYESNRGGVKVGGSAGSGVIIDYGFNREGGTAYIVTNYHVLYESSADTQNKISDCIYVYPYGARNYFTDGDGTGDDILDDVNGDGKRDANDQGDMGGDGIRATFVGGAMDYDIAILKVEGSEYLKNNTAYAPAVWGDSGKLQIGEKAFAIGNSNGEGISVTQGVVSVDSEYIDMSALDGRDTNGDKQVDSVQFRVLRTDAAINHGNSGGALFNAKGELIGITNAKNVEDETDNMGYALPATQVKYLVGNILSNSGIGKVGYVSRAMLGVMTSIENSYGTIDEETGGVKIVEEITIAQISGTSTAGKTGGLKVGDIFKSVTLNDPEDRTKTKTFEISRQYEVNDLLLTVRKGDTVVFSVLREGKIQGVSITFNQDGYFVKYA